MVIQGATEIAASLGFATLLFRVREPRYRSRIALVSASLFAWIAGGLVATGTDGGLWRLAGIVTFDSIAGLAVLAAYRPPRALLRLIAPDDDAERERRV